MFHGHLDYFQNPPLGGKSNTKPGDHDTLNTHSRWCIIFYHVWRPTWIDIHRNSIWLRARSHVTSHCTWGSVTTLHDFGGVLERPLDTFFWTLTNSWSRLLARVWSGLYCNLIYNRNLLGVDSNLQLCSWIGYKYHWSPPKHLRNIFFGK
jgi:hypothetical protein